MQSVNGNNAAFSFIRNVIGKANSFWLAPEDKFPVAHSPGTLLFESHPCSLTLNA
jgi:hypothetical protein